MSVNLKLSEADLKTSVIDYLQYKMNMRQLWFTRLNSGTFILESEGQFRRRITGCPKGTADILVITAGRVIFFELKTETGRMSNAQASFKLAVEEQKAEYYVIRSVNEAIGVIEGLKGGSEV